MRGAAIIIMLGACGFDRGEGAAIDGDPNAVDGALIVDAPVVDAPSAIDSRPGEPDAAPDATPDASPDANTSFDPDLCPGGYSQWSTPDNGSRYRLIGSGAAYATQHADCADDSDGWTHIVTLETIGEAALMKSSLTGGYIYVGAVQAPSSPSDSAGWFALTGAAVPGTMWGSGQPNDGGDNVENNEQNAAAMQVDVTDLMNDVEWTWQYGTVCECDGHAVDPTVAGYIP